MQDWSFKIVDRGHERARLGESPCWDPATDALWWVDIEGRKLLRTDLASATTQAWDTPEEPGFVVLTEANAPAVGMETGIRAFAPGTGAFAPFVRYAEPGCRFNDATVDASGRLWASTMKRDAEAGRASIHLVTRGLTLETVVSGLTIPNGLAVDLDRGRALYSDSHPDVRSIFVMPIGGDARPTADASHFASTADLRGRPDGAALSRDGSYWIAGVDGSELYVFDLDGALDAVIAVPFPAPTKLCFAGHDGRRVVVTSKGVGEAGGYLAQAPVPPLVSPGTVQPYWLAGAR